MWQERININGKLCLLFIDGYTLIRFKNTNHAYQETQIFLSKGKQAVHFWGKHKICGNIFHHSGNPGNFLYFEHIRIWQFHGIVYS